MNWILDQFPCTIFNFTIFYISLKIVGDSKFPYLTVIYLITCLQLVIVVFQKADYVLSPRHLTLLTLPSGKFTLEIVTEIYPQNNTSLEVKQCLSYIRMSVLHVVCLYPRVVMILRFRAFTRLLGISVHNVKQKVSEKLLSIRLIFVDYLFVIVFVSWLFTSSLLIDAFDFTIRIALILWQNTHAALKVINHYTQYCCLMEIS